MVSRILLKNRRFIAHIVLWAFSPMGHYMSGPFGPSPCGIGLDHMGQIDSSGQHLLVMHEDEEIRSHLEREREGEWVYRKRVAVREG